MFRFLLWRKFGEGGSTPRNFSLTLKELASRSISKELLSRLRKSQTQWYEKAKAYRDCVEHYKPLWEAFPCARLRWLPGGVLSVQLPLPDNPEKKSARKFEYKLELDALSWGWELTNEVVRIGRAIIEAIRPKESAY